VTKNEAMRHLKLEIQELMGALSVEEIILNRALIQQIEIALVELKKSA
jgi:hypothetical protein